MTLFDNRFRRIVRFTWKWYWAFLKLFPLLCAASLELFFRHSFGERHLRRVAVSVAVFGVYSIYAVDMARLVGRPSACPPFLAFLVILLIAELVRRWRGRAEVAPFSYATGRSWRFWQIFRLNEDRVQRFGEPLIAFATSLSIEEFDPVLSGWMMVGAVALFIKQWWFRREIRRRSIDAMDSRAEARMLQDPSRARRGGRSRDGFETVRPANAGRRPRSHRRRPLPRSRRLH